MEVKVRQVQDIAEIILNLYEQRVETTNMMKWFGRCSRRLCAILVEIRGIGT